ncbi:MAG TPA: translation initiation factor IF-2, partial [Lentisphaeria bacterium]|nr:translation initiation factor IF-2 [Lentisphaeria bacterium]
MRERVRVHILAKELGLENKELVSLLSDAGHEVKSHLAGIDVEVAEQIRQQFQNGNGSTTAVETAAPPPEPE